MVAEIHEGDLVVVTEDIAYSYERDADGNGEPDCTLHRDLQGRVRQISAEGHALVRFPAPHLDKWVLQEDIYLLKAVVDTERAPYADHGEPSAVPLVPAALPEPVTPAPRLSNPAQFVPVAFLSCTIAFLYCVYVFCHCLPLMQLKEQPDMVDHDARLRGTVSLVVFSVVTLLLVVSYLRAVLTHPGTIPGDDPHWQYHMDEQDASKYRPQWMKETKKQGERRHCKWCHRFKPDRCHHCKVCGTCILKMDHHCPWIYNCVGFRNHKYFFLLLFYGCLSCHFITWTMLETVQASISNDKMDRSSLVDDASQRLGLAAAPSRHASGAGTPVMPLFWLLFGETLAAVFGILVTTPFFGFHVYLMLKGMTTIEFCEKTSKGEHASSYNRGLWCNIRAVLGENPFMWPMPVCPPSGSGLIFTLAEEVASPRQMEAGRGYGSVKRSSRSGSRRGGKSALLESPLAPAKGGRPLEGEQILSPSERA